MLSPRTAGELQAPWRYDYTRSTAESFRALDTDEQAQKFHWFSSVFAGSRSKLDMGYHGLYTVQRQRLQDSIVQDIITTGSKKTCEDPWVVFSAGAMGAGKSFAVRWMSNKGYFPLPDFVKVDADSIRTYLPEWGGYIVAQPLDAGRLTRSEAGMCVEIAMDAAMQNRKNVWVDGSLRESAWFESLFHRIAREFPHYRIAILYVSADRGAIMRRVRRRGRQTGRLVPEEEVIDSIERVPESVQLLRSKADFVAYIDNGAGRPRLLSYFTRQEGTVTFDDPISTDNWRVCSERWATLPVLDDENSPYLRAKVIQMIRSGDVVLFSKSFCIWCERLKTRLRGLEIPFREHVIDTDTTIDRGSACGVGLQLELNRMTNMHTLPKLFVGGVHVHHRAASDEELRDATAAAGRAKAHFRAAL